jgi:ubiquinone/menaquinone biosynthesis C-methylase UbiE
VSGSLDDAAGRARRTYDAASDHYDAEPLGFWARTGRLTVERLALPHGAVVLDAPCGSGASALPAAAAVGAEGRVLAVDLSERLLALGRAKAATAGLGNVEFRQADMRELDLPEASLDAVVCVFGIFFVPDMATQVRRFWRLLRPGGALAITTWGPELLEPGVSAFWDAVGAVRPDLERAYNPWEGLVTPGGLRGLYEEAGIDGAEAELVEDEQPLRTPDDFWAIVLGSGYRATTDALQPDERERVRRQTLDVLAGATAVRTPAVHGVARAPS